MELTPEELDVLNGILLVEWARRGTRKVEGIATQELRGVLARILEFLDAPDRPASIFADVHRMDAFIRTFQEKMNEEQMTWADDVGPWTDDGAWLTLFQLAAFAAAQSGSDGVISVYVKGPDAKLGWSLPPEVYPKMPMLLERAHSESFNGLAWVISAGIAIPEEVRQEINELLQQPRPPKPNLNS